jgi:hypothetical protein
MPRMRRPLVSILVASATALGCRSSTFGEQAFTAIVDDPAEHTTRPYCIPDGRRVLSAGFRHPTWCTVHFAEGNAIWRRDARGGILSAGRMWVLHAEDSLRWPHLRDSVTREVRALAGDGTPCFSERPVGNGGRATMWLLPGYRLGVTRFERWPQGSGGYELQVGMVRDSGCPPSPRPPA